jgi:TrpR family transcriptional regulator, trp operon repressor
MSERELIDQFTTTLLRYKDRKSLITFLKAILTPKELQEIPKRLEIVRLLKKNIPQRQIADQLGVGVATVTRGSRELHKGSFKDIT